MHTLLVREESRSGNFEIPAGFHGKLRVLSSGPSLVGVIQSLDPESDFNFEIRCVKDSNPVGLCQFNVQALSCSKFIQITLPVIGSPDCAFLTLYVCWVTPLQSSITTSVPRSYPSAFAIGHRGSGSNKVSTEFLENTLTSFEAADRRGADFVEFDVQLSRDGVPVIYHDMIGFVTKYPLDGIEPHETTKDGGYRYVIKQFSESHFRKTGLTTIFQTERPTFEDLLKTLPVSLGFDVELKYPAPYKLNERIPYFEMNQFVEGILEVTNAHAGDRQIFFSSFDPFVCAMLALKQSKFPIFQLFNCKRRWSDVSVMAAKVRQIVSLHRELGIQGFVFDGGHLLQTPELIPELKEQGFVMCTYGGINNSPEGIRKQLGMGIVGICTDDMAMARSVVDEHIRGG
jgi:glycerophosphodiester phosphodiesterase